MSLNRHVAFPICAIISLPETTLYLGAALLIVAPQSCKFVAAKGFLIKSYPEPAMRLIHNARDSFERGR